MFEHAVHHTVKDGTAGESHHTPERLTEGWRVSWRCSCKGERGGREDEDVCVFGAGVGRRRKEVQEEKLQILSTYVRLDSQHQQP